MKKIDKLYNCIFLIFCFMIPLGHLAKAIPNIVMILLVALFPFHSLKWRIKVIKKELLVILLFIIVVIANSLIFKRWGDLDVISKLFYIPIVLALSSPIKTNRFYLISFIAGAFSILIVSAIQIGMEVFRNNEFELINGGHINKFLLGERPYLGFIYLISACFSFYLSVNSTERIYKMIWIIVGVVFVGFVFIIAARMAVLCILICSVLSLFYFVRKLKFNYRWLFVIPIIALFFVGFSDNLLKRLYINDENISFFKAEPRYYIWDCAYTIAPDNVKEFIFGKGYAQVENELVECYRNKENFLDTEHKQWFIDSNFNTHNQFFDLFLSQGVISLIIFLFSFLYLFVTNRKNFFILSIVLSAFLFLLVENVLTRQIGCMLIAFVLCFVFYKRDKT